MNPFTPTDIQEASKGASSYKEFRENLKDMGHRLPSPVGKFPMNMKGWKRKLRYECSQDYTFGEHPSGHDLRQREYYERLERMGHPDPLMIF